MKSITIMIQDVVHLRPYVVVVVVFLRFAFFMWYKWAMTVFLHFAFFIYFVEFFQFILIYLLSRHMLLWYKWATTVVDAAIMTLAGAYNISGCIRTAAIYHRSSLMQRAGSA